MDVPRQKPITYLSLQCILPFMDARLRQKLVSQCLGLNFVDKSIPLKLDTFSMRRFSFKLNEHHYYLHLIRHRRGKSTSKFELVKLADYTNFDDTLEKLNEERVEKPSLEETNEKILNEKKLREKLFLLNDKNHMRDWTMLEWEVTKLRKSIQDYNEQLARSETTTSYCYRHVYDFHDTSRNELVCYALTYQDALRYLSEKVLGGRTVHVKNLNHVEGLNLTWPERLTIKVEEPECVLKISGHQIVSIEFPSKNGACFTDFLDPQFVKKPKCRLPYMMFTFRVTWDQLQETMRVLVSMTESLTRIQQKKIQYMKNRKVFPIEFHFNMPDLANDQIDFDEMMLEAEVSYDLCKKYPGANYLVQFKTVSPWF